MFASKSNFIPILTSGAGLSLTSANWQESGVGAAAYYLDSLLLKPGFNVLNNLSDLASYVNWSGTMIINASQFSKSKEGIFNLVSPFDGSKTKVSYIQLIDLIKQLNPQMVILPPKILKEYPQVLDNWPDTITPFFFVDELAIYKVPFTHGMYFQGDELTIEQLGEWNHVPKYLQGTINAKLREQLHQVNYIESNEAAELGMQGTVYSAAGTIDLTDSALFSFSFAPIDPDCLCPTCTAKFSHAYLHHLYIHTPLLAQRLLIQHNVYCQQSSLRK